MHTKSDEGESGGGAGDLKRDEKKTSASHSYSAHAAVARGGTARDATHSDPHEGERRRGKGEVEGGRGGGEETEKLKAQVASMSQQIQDLQQLLSAATQGEVGGGGGGGERHMRRMLLAKNFLLSKQVLFPSLQFSNTHTNTHTQVHTNTYLYTHIHADQRTSSTFLSISTRLPRMPRVST